METTVAQVIEENETFADLLDVSIVDLFPEESTEPVDTMHVSRLIHAIRKVEGQIDQYDVQEKEAKEFYARRRVKCEERIGALKTSVMNFLKQNGLKNIQTPNGTAYTKTLTLKHWPEDDALLAWIDENKVNAIRTKREPDKKALAEHIKNTGETPDGYDESLETRLYVK